MKWLGVQAVGQSDQQRLNPQKVEIPALHHADGDNGDDEQNANAADWKAKRRAFLQGLVFEIYGAMTDFGQPFDDCS